MIKKKDIVLFFIVYRQLKVHILDVSLIFVVSYLMELLKNETDKVILENWLPSTRD